MRSRLRMPEGSDIDYLDRKHDNSGAFIVFEEIERLHPPQIAAFGRTLHRFTGESHDRKGQVVCGFAKRFKTSADARRYAEASKAKWESGKRNLYSYTVLKQIVSNLSAVRSLIST